MMYVGCWYVFGVFVVVFGVVCCGVFFVLVVVVVFVVGGVGGVYGGVLLVGNFVVL